MGGGRACRGAVTCGVVVGAAAPPRSDAPPCPPAHWQIGDLKMLEDFNLEDNKLTKLPKSVQKGALESLKGLYLQNNKLSALGFVKTMPALRKMSIAGNDFMLDKKLKEEVDKELADSGVTVGSASS